MVTSVDKNWKLLIVYFLVGCLISSQKSELIKHALKLLK